MERATMETYFDNMTAQEGTGEKLLADLKVLVQDAEALVKAAGGNLAEKSRTELHATLERLKVAASRAQDKAAAGAARADRLVRDHPYESIGLAFGIGLLIGVMLKRD